MMSRTRVWLLMLVCGLVLAVLLPGAAQAASFGVGAFTASNCKVKTCIGTEVPNGPVPFEEVPYWFPKEPDNAEAKTQGFVQAGGRVPFGVTDFEVNTEGTFPNSKPAGAPVKKVRVDVAAGLATSPAAVPTCKVSELGTEIAPGSGLFTAPTCKAETEIGKEYVTLYVKALEEAKEPFSDVPVQGEVYNLEQPEGLASYYGAALKLPKFLTEAEGVPGGPYYVHGFVKGSVEWGQEAEGTSQGDYHDYFTVDIAPGTELVSSRQVLEGTRGEGDFITNATSCPGDNTTYVTLTSTGGEVQRRPYTTPIGLKGCNLGSEDLEGITGLEQVPFEPAFAFTPGSVGTDAPNPFSVTASLSNAPKAVAQSQVKTATAILPEGMTLNPSAAHNLQACTPAQAHIHSATFGTECPAGSEVGTVNLEVPTLPPGSLTGSVYLGAPESGPITGPPYTMYVVANSKRYGISVRLRAEVIPGPTGQVTTVFPENPEQPFTSLTLKFERGMLAPVANPLLCGPANGIATFSPTTNRSSVNDAFGETVIGCATTPPPFNPVQNTVNANSNAGASTSFTLNLARNDGEQYVGSVRTVLPPGLVGKISTAERCSAASAESETAACPAASQIGTATVLAGSGTEPFSFSGPVYLTGSVKGFPYGLSIKVPAVAGPFNLGTVVTVAGITVDPYTSQAIVETTLPRIRGGIPLRVRNISVAINKPGFMINPTNCGALQTVSTLGGFSLTGGPLTASKAVPTGFQVGNCSALKFAPKFKANSNAKTSRSNGAALVTEVTQAAGQANIKSVKVQLPRSLPSRLTTLQKACTEQVFNVNPLRCPSGSFVGGAVVKTPTLPQPLRGPAILVSHANAAFPDLDLVVEDPNHLRVILVGNTNIKNSITTTTFASTPDVPVSSVRVELPIGSHSALAAYGNICAKSLVMPTTMTAQNGKTFKQNTVINVAGCPVEIVGRKVVGNFVYITARVPAAGRVSVSGIYLRTTKKKAGKAHQNVTLKVPLSSSGRGKKPLTVHVRVGFVPKKGKNSVASTKVSFH